MNTDKGKITTRLLPLTNDLVFKAVYGRNTKASNAALKALLNRLLEKEKDPIVWVHCENPFSYQTYVDEKEIIMDIKIRLSSGQLLDLEMQVNHLTHYKKRAIYYMGKLVNESLECGEDYDKMKETIVISIVDGILFPKFDNVYSTFYLKEKDTNNLLDKITQINFLELGKVDIESKPISEMTSHERLAVYFKYAADDSKQDYLDQLLEYEKEVLDMTTPILEEISAEKQMREIAEAHRRYHINLNSAKSYGLRVGREKGREEGRSEGEVLKLVRQVCAKLSKQKSIEAIAEELEEDISLIELIYTVASKFSPNYDIEKIFDELNQYR